MIDSVPTLVFNAGAEIFNLDAPSAVMSARVGVQRRDALLDVGPPGTISQCSVVRRAANG